MILVDPPVWIELLAGRNQASRRDLPSMATFGPIIQDVLQGLRPGRREQRIRWHLLGLLRAGNPLAVDLSLEAADLYPSGGCRIAIRFSVDCLVASIAIWHKIPVQYLHRDFGKLASFSPLEIWTPS